MKKQNGKKDVKKTAANDVEKEAPKSKRSKPAEDAKYVIGNISTVKRGFLLAMIKFVETKGEVDHAMLVKEFSGRQFDSRKVDVGRITRYLAYCRVHGILRVSK